MSRSRGRDADRDHARMRRLSEVLLDLTTGVPLTRDEGRHVALMLLRLCASGALPPCYGAPQRISSEVPLEVPSLKTKPRHRGADDGESVIL